MTTGEQTITWDEMKNALTAFGKKHDFEPLPKEAWKEMKKMFDYVDTDKSGSIDLDELS